MSKKSVRHNAKAWTRFCTNIYGHKNEPNKARRFFSRRNHELCRKCFKAAFGRPRPKNRTPKAA